MLIRFSVENFSSFGERQEFSMVKGPVRRLSHHVIPAATSFGPKLLKTAALYGANASGKSNLVKAMSVARQLVVGGTNEHERLPVVPFRLSTSWAKEPSRFEFEIVAGEMNYAYSISATATEVREEWLYEIGRHRDRPIFNRSSGGGSP